MDIQTTCILESVKSVTNSTLYVEKINKFYVNILYYFKKQISSYLLSFKNESSLNLLTVFYDDLSKQVLVFASKMTPKILYLFESG